MPWSSAISVPNVENPVDKVDNRLSAQPLIFAGPVLGVFAKQPRTGQVKTRLTPPLQPEAAAGLYRVALTETVARLSAAPVRLVLCCAGRRAWFDKAFPDVALLPQGRGDLGMRLARVTAALFATGGEPVALAGSDSPDLPLSLIDAAFVALATADAAAIPCMDGGFALLALRRPVPELFTGIPWSTPTTLAELRLRATALGLRFTTVGLWDDLDDLDALRRLLERTPECTTAQYARAHLGSALGAGSG
jgi:rSAM/selenodomain-associated transferase 1